MSLHEYKDSVLLRNEMYAFYSLIMAAFRQADSINFEKLKAAFPEVWEEVQSRYYMPGGILDTDDVPEGTRESIKETRKGMGLD